MNNLPDGTSLDNQGIAELAEQSRVAAFEEGRCSWFDLLLEHTMMLSAIVDPDKLVAALAGIRAFTEEWASDIQARKVSI